MYKQIEIDNKKWNYLIYDDGRIYSLKTKKFLSPDTSSGYARYILCYNKQKKRVNAHTMVGLHFIPNPKKLPILNHKDGNILNNNISNLEWISYSDNVKNENRHKHEKIQQKFSEKDVLSEEWKLFRDGRYSISNIGRLKLTKENRILEGHINPITTYIRDNLTFFNGKKETIPRHRIVYEAFHPNENMIIINHIDGNKINNRLSNLENITQSENTKKAYTETKKKQTRKCKGINLKTNEEKIFFSISDAATFISCEESNIRNALNLHNRQGGGKSHGWQWFNLTNEEYSQILKSSETIENITKEKDFSE